MLYLARRDMAQNNHEEGVSVLKPLCGADDDLECNLRAFFEQDHQRFELVFGVEGHEDPAVDVVHRLMAE